MRGTAVFEALTLLALAVMAAAAGYGIARLEAGHRPEAAAGLAVAGLASWCSIRLGDEVRRRRHGG